MSDRMKAALILASHGFDVISLWSTRPDGTCRCPKGARCDQKPGKHPIAPDGKWHETHDPEQIETLLSAASEPNYGVAPPIGCFALDIDGPHIDLIRELEAKHGPLPDTYQHLTRNGRHAFYRWPPGVDRPGSANLFGIVTRWSVREATGRGYVVGPGSVIGDFTYRSAGRPDEIATLPVEWAMAAAERERSARPALADIHAGSRHPELRDAARYLRGRGFEGPALRSAVDVINAALPEPKTPAEVTRAIGNVERRFAPDAPAITVLPASPAALPFYSPIELAGMTLAEMRWIVGLGLVGLGAITEIDGKIKAAGKTTLVLWMVRAILDGAEFLGADTVRSRVLIVTEQSRQTFMDALRRAGLDQRGDELRILFREDIGSAGWAAVVGACRVDGYDVVVFDTIGKLAGVRQENEAGEWAAAMAPLQDLAASGRAVIVLRHDRKGGGDVGDSGRGSSQASGDVDIILALRRPEGNQPSNRRVLESLSRYPETPEKIVVELTPTGYVLLGTDEAVAANDALGFVSAAIGSELRQTGGGLTMKQLEELGRDRSPAVKRTAIQAAIDVLEQRGDIVRSGLGKPHHPYVFSAPDGVRAESAETQSSNGRQNFEPVDLYAKAQEIFADDLIGGAA